MRTVYKLLLIALLALSGRAYTTYFAPLWLILIAAIVDIVALVILVRMFSTDAKRRAALQKATDDEIDRQTELRAMQEYHSKDSKGDRA